MSKYKSFQEYWDSLDYDLPSVAANSAYDAAKAAWEATDAPLLAEQNAKMLAMFKKIESMYAKGDERFMYTEMHEICALIAEIED